LLPHPQEEGNIPYVLENKVGAFSQDVEEIARTIGGWLGAARGEMQEMVERAKRLGKPEATFNIVRDLAALVKAA
jgi:1,2-diacylglycerol 3-beta-galactosyltransferase